jgi:DNA-binding response OmpR family regulator
MPDSSTILLVDDEESIQKLLTYPLERDGYRVLQARDGELALRTFREEHVDLVVLDVMLPRIDGLEVCRRLRAESTIPIIMLTARDDELDKVLGLELGADDYITKPFGLRELAARVRAVLRRGRTELAGAARSPETFVYRGKHLLADFDAVSVSVDGQPVRLTRREFELLRHLVENRNRVLSRDRLLERVWGYDRLVETRSVDVHVGRLRSKLGQAGRQIETVVGLGYRFVE